MPKIKGNSSDMPTVPPSPGKIPTITPTTTPNNINPSGTLLSRVTWPGAGYSHQCWHNDDFTWVISNDETALNSTWQMVNITDLNNATMGVQQSIPGSANNHNNYT